MLDLPSKTLVRERLAAHGVDFSLENVVAEPVSVASVPWWDSNGNKLFLGEGVPVPELIPHPGLPPPRNAVVSIGYGSNVGRMLLWGEAPVLCFGYSVSLPVPWIACGGASTIVVNTGVSATEGLQLNARNGGLIYVGKDGLWSSAVTIYTDDMHAICSRDTGKRINPRGGQIVIEDRVWMGYQSMIIRSARIGHDTVVGARALVTGDLPSHSVCGGVPARQLRDGIVWNQQDLPLDEG